MTDIVKRSLPKVLEKELNSAKQAVEELEHEVLCELLARYQRHSARMQVALAATFGITPPDKSALPKVDCEYIPLEWMGPISRLDDALRKLNAYNAGGASEYVAEDVYRAGQQAVAKRSRQSSSKIEEVNLEEELERRGYFDNPGREKRSQIVHALAQKTGLSRSSINRHIKKFLDARNR